MVAVPDPFKRQRQNGGRDAAAATGNDGLFQIHPGGFEFGTQGIGRFHRAVRVQQPPKGDVARAGDVPGPQAGARFCCFAPEAFGGAGVEHLPLAALRQGYIAPSLDDLRESEHVVAVREERGDASPIVACGQVEGDGDAVDVALEPFGDTGLAGLARTAIASRAGAAAGALTLTGALRFGAGPEC